MRHTVTYPKLAHPCDNAVRRLQSTLFGCSIFTPSIAGLLGNKGLWCSSTSVCKPGSTPLSFAQRQRIMSWWAKKCKTWGFSWKNEKRKNLEDDKDKTQDLEKQ